MDNEASHDQVSRTKSCWRLKPKDWRRMDKTHPGSAPREDSVIADHSIVGTLHKNENEVICCHCDHAKVYAVKGINIFRGDRFCEYEVKTENARR